MKVLDNEPDFKPIKIVLETGKDLSALFGILNIFENFEHYNKEKLYKNSVEFCKNLILELRKHENLTGDKLSPTDRKENDVVA